MDRPRNHWRTLTGDPPPPPPPSSIHPYIAPSPEAHPSVFSLFSCDRFIQCGGGRGFRQMTYIDVSTSFTWSCSACDCVKRMTFDVWAPSLFDCALRRGCVWVEWHFPSLIHFYWSLKTHHISKAHWSHTLFDQNGYYWLNELDRPGHKWARFPGNSQSLDC